MLLPPKKMPPWPYNPFWVDSCIVSNSSPATIKEKETSSEPPSIILRCENDFMNFCKTAWDSSSDGEEEGEKRKVPDVRKDDLASRRGRRGPTTAKVHQFVPSPECTNKDMERWEGIRRASQQTLQDKDIRSAMHDLTSFWKLYLFD